MGINCSYCGRETEKPVVCSVCNNFTCQNCFFEKDGKEKCIRCFLDENPPKERERILTILNTMGVAEANKRTELVFHNMPIVELSYTKFREASEHVIKCKLGAVIRSFNVDFDTFDKFWLKALKYQYEPERIPFGKRIVML